MAPAEPREPLRLGRMLLGAFIAFNGLSIMGLAFSIAGTSGGRRRIRIRGEFRFGDWSDTLIGVPAWAYLTLGVIVLAIGLRLSIPSLRRVLRRLSDA